MNRSFAFKFTLKSHLLNLLMLANSPPPPPSYFTWLMCCVSVCVCMFMWPHIRLCVCVSLSCLVSWFELLGFIVSISAHGVSVWMQFTLEFCTAHQSILNQRCALCKHFIIIVMWEMTFYLDVNLTSIKNTHIQLLQLCVCVYVCVCLISPRSEQT